MMKKKTIFFATLVAVSFSSLAQVGIGTTTPNSAAILELKSTSKGLLLPRMLETEMNAISPVAGLMLYCTDCNPKGVYYNDGFNFVNSTNGNPSNLSETDVYSPYTGKIWMDRNLGATRIATSSTDIAAYGDYYQWGRAADGHQEYNNNANTTTTVSGTHTPNHVNFIAGSSVWHSPQNNNLWQGVNGINNPCPSGYKVPSESEWLSEISSWPNSTEAFDSFLKLPLPGARETTQNGQLFNAGSHGYYWSSTTRVHESGARFMYFINSSVTSEPGVNARGFSVRCIKD